MGQLLTDPPVTTATRIRRRAGRPRNRAALLFLPALLLLLPVFVLPTVLLLTSSLTEPPGGFEHYREALSSDLIRQVLVRSLTISAIVTAISLAVGLPYAVAAVRSGPRLRGLLLGAVASTLFFSVIVRAYAWLALLDQDGVVPKLLHVLGLAGSDLTLANSRAGTIIGMVQYGIPFMVMAIYDTYRRADPQLERAAAVCGAGALTRWRRVTIPLLAPGIAAGIIIVFITTLGYYILPAILGSPQDLMIGQLISQYVGMALNVGLGAALSCILLAVTVGAYLLFRRLNAQTGPSL